MTQSGGFVILNKVKNPFGNSLIIASGFLRLHRNYQRSKQLSLLVFGMWQQPKPDEIMVSQCHGDYAVSLFITESADFVFDIF
jgi:hypothetical protein